jgi:hypothetical protein
MAAKGRGDALCDLLQCLQRCGFYGLSLLCLPGHFAVQVAQLSIGTGMFFHPYNTIN